MRGCARVCAVVSECELTHRPATHRPCHTPPCHASGEQPHVVIDVLRLGCGRARASACYTGLEPHRLPRRRADRVPVRPTTHTFEPWLGQAEETAAAMGGGGSRPALAGRAHAARPTLHYNYNYTRTYCCDCLLLATYELRATSYSLLATLAGGAHAARTLTLTLTLTLTPTPTRQSPRSSHATPGANPTGYTWTHPKRCLGYGSAWG